jgi:hypothetical protein
LLALFAVNWFHSLAHLAIGAVGVAVYRSYSGSKVYALALGVAYAGLFLLGVLTADVATLGGLLPLNGLDDLLHIASSLITKHDTVATWVHPSNGRTSENTT